MVHYYRFAYTCTKNIPTLTCMSTQLVFQVTVSQNFTQMPNINFRSSFPPLQLPCVKNWEDKDGESSILF